MIDLRDQTWKQGGVERTEEESSKKAPMGGDKGPEKGFGS